MSTALVAGGSGFVGSHLVDRLVADGHRVIAVDNFVTGRAENLAQHARNPEFRLMEHDVTEPLTVDEPLDAVFHLASPASPVDFDTLPEEIIWVNTLGTRHLCDLAQAHGARFLFASTSEIYGDPLEHPQRESYFGNVNSVGPRAPYDEGKRLGEALVMSRRRRDGLDARIVRIFNTYGPRMRLGDGRMSVEFVRRAIDGEPLTIWGDGEVTRSLCYVSDLVDGLQRAMFTDDTDGGVFNLGNPDEHSVAYYARLIIDLAESKSRIEHREPRPDDPQRRRPDTSRAERDLGWRPQVSQALGFERTIAWYRDQSRFADSR